ncbi:DMT family transporter [Novosphingobium sp. KCTC 2891]|uniref:DMT family transporter n=1 Tax=Novosphingobium sp. KCTC 2891 TaxID=2989730 RepID=UPI0022231698|nr:DMT family transporter [Novosphingobium sp. KCTC 2891]MCW1381641.1 DMT family transporter [Novosphingobium sp. KCTC 2891]
MTWLPAALLAGLFQAWRTAIQQQLRSLLSVSGAGFVRYAWGLPFALVLAGGWLWAWRLPVPAMSAGYLAFAAGAGICQILGTVLLIMGFGHRGFVVGTAFAKTEALQAALVAAVVLGERLPGLAWAGIGCGVAGVLALMGQGLGPRDAGRALVQPAALCGLGAGALFAMTGVLVKLATARLAGVDAVTAALVTLVVVLAIQALLHGGWIAAKEPQTLRKVWQSWRTSARVGLLSALGSACWFTGFALAPVALVRIVGQVEVIFTVLFARRLLGERARVHEVAGLMLVALGVILALLPALGRAA